VDFDLLRQELSKEIVEGPQERYHLNWPGKRKALLAANAPVVKTLRPCRDESVDFDMTRHIFIEGDNLDALKLLQETYLGKVKMIYIDPPYNTGSDLLYDDDYCESTESYRVTSGEVDAIGHRLVANTEANGRFHSDWLSFIYPRLRLARSLLRDDGFVFISINDVEQPKLRMIADEVLGEDNFVAALIWLKGKEGGNDNSGFGVHHDYILCYARDAKRAGATIQLDDKDTSRHITALPEPNLVKLGTSVYRDGEQFQLINLSKQKDYRVVIPLNDGSTIEWDSYCPQSTIDRFVACGKLFVGEKRVPYVKSFLADEKPGSKPSTIIDKVHGTTKAGGIRIRELFGDGRVFSYPKPVSLIQRLIQIATDPADRECIVLDFFGGSGTSAEAVLAQNAADGGARRYIIVQLAEPLDAANEDHAPAIQVCDQLGRPRNIAELSKERIRRAALDVSKVPTLSASRVDYGLRVLRLDSSNMKDVYYRPDETSAELLGGHVDNIKEDRSDEDLLFQVLLDWGVDLSWPIKKETISGKPVYFVDENALAACFAAGIDEALVKALAARKPLRAVFRDSGYGGDDVKINVEQIFKQLSPATEVKTL
jgi:adenine-specific DNA-methyltransferase